MHIMNVSILPNFLIFLFVSLFVFYGNYLFDDLI